MKESTVTAKLLPKSERTSTGQEVAGTLSATVARFSSVREQVRNQEEETSALDKVVAPWFNDAVEVALTHYVKAANLADEMGVDEHYLSHMRNGKKPVALRHLVPVVKWSDAATVICERIRPTKISAETVKQVALELLLNSDPLRKTLEREIQERYGAGADDVARALIDDRK